MGKQRTWADNVRAIHSTVSEAFHEAWKKSGLSFGEFCDRLLGHVGWEPHLNASLTTERQQLARLVADVELTQAKIQAIEDLKREKERRFDAAVEDIAVKA